MSPGHVNFETTWKCVAQSHVWSTFSKICRLFQSNNDAGCGGIYFQASRVHHVVDAIESFCGYQNFSIFQGHASVFWSVLVNFVHDTCAVQGTWRNWWKHLGMAGLSVKLLTLKGHILSVEKYQEFSAFELHLINPALFFLRNTVFLGWSISSTFTSQHARFVCNVEMLQFYENNHLALLTNSVVWILISQAVHSFEFTKNSNVLSFRRKKKIWAHHFLCAIFTIFHFMFGSIYILLDFLLFNPADGVAVWDI